MLFWHSAAIWQQMPSGWHLESGHVKLNKFGLFSNIWSSIRRILFIFQVWILQLGVRWMNGWERQRFLIRCWRRIIALDFNIPAYGNNIHQIVFSRSYY